MSLIEINGLTKNFGGLLAVDHVDITVETGEILGIIGPNGAGKTTLFNLITGFFTPDGERPFPGRRHYRIFPSKSLPQGDNSHVSTDQAVWGYDHP